MPSNNRANGSETKTWARLQKMRLELKPEHKRLVNEFWNQHQQTGQWPTTRSIHGRFGGKAEVKCHLQTLGGGIVFERLDHPGSRYELSILGILLTECGDEYAGLLTKYLGFLRKKLYEEPERRDFTDVEIATAIKISEPQRQLLGKLVCFSHLFTSFSPGLNSWSIAVPSFVEELPATGEIGDAIERNVFHEYLQTRPVYLEDQLSQQAESIPGDASVPKTEPVSEANSGVVVDSLKRKYQVFVSSTYEDLKEERHHVIQALLESKCIPTGMELFPAASIEQWDLIKKVIQECDYYIVIIAGRYGSLGNAGIGYTEMEFDYAVKIGKPVIGFYHKDPKILSVAKSEDTDKGKKRLKVFTEKVKKRLCKSWVSADELSSAVKSAIFNQLETNPQPGWVRADVLPASDAVDKLKQRVAYLEGKLKQRKPIAPKALFDKGQTIEIHLSIDYDFQLVKNDFFPDVTTNEPHKFIDHTVELPWVEFILITSGNLQCGATLGCIAETVHRALSANVKLFIASHTGNQNEKHDFKISEHRLERILKTLMAKKLLKMRSNYGSWVDPFWQFTPKGLQYLAELESISS